VHLAKPLVDTPQLDDRLWLHRLALRVTSPCSR
jgi:hypothetical protein